MRDGEAAGIGVSLAHLLGEASLQDRVRRGDVRTAAGSREARSSREAGGRLVTAGRQAESVCTGTGPPPPSSHPKSRQ